MSDFDQFKDTYIAECYELLADMEDKLMSLDCDAVDMDQVNAIFRCAHSIKGGSGAFGLSYITNFTHVLEALLDLMREEKISATKEVVDTLLRAADIVIKMVDIAKNDGTPPAGLGDDILVQLNALVLGNNGKAIAQTATTNVKHVASTSGIYTITFVPKSGLFHTGNEPLLLLRELARLGDATVVAHTENLPAFHTLNPTECHLSWTITLATEKSESVVREVFEFVEDYCSLTFAFTPAAAQVQATTEDAYGLFDTPEAPPVESPHRTTAPDVSATRTIPVEGKSEDASARSAPATSGSYATTSIRVDLDKIDRLVNMIGELVITEAMLKAQARHLHQDEFAGLLRGIDELSQHTREIQEAVMSVRMQPVKSIFARMPRIVRDLSAQLGKDIRLVTHGENTEVDKTVIEQLGDPLTHMIRNSVDHGIETPDIRVESGKPAQGTIDLSAFHQGGRIIIEIRDDGAGINRSKVLSKAREKGLIAPDAILTDDEADNLIFMPGFSTADVVSNISGRGVGMDVVRRNIEGLEGTVRVKTEPGKGSLFTVSLPLTLAILDGMIVRVGRENYIIPIISIIETMRPKREEVRHVEGHSDVINVRGEFIPLIYLHQVFHIKDAERDASKALVVLVEAGHEKLGVVVDELIGQQQVVIKSLEANTDAVPGISGATILGDGRVSLILEINQLKQLGIHEHPPHHPSISHAA